MGGGGSETLLVKFKLMSFMDIGQSLKKQKDTIEMYFGKNP